MLNPAVAFFQMKTSGRYRPQLLHSEDETGTRRSKTSPNEQTPEVGCNRVEVENWRISKVVVTKHSKYEQALYYPLCTDFAAHF